ncbi:MAG TPA: hypothetical protein VFN19_05200 [Candidatus Nanopelagicales bacterium]|nr:hypothetical protein [Candidatus Nanopelagicales bacterium]
MKSLLGGGVLVLVMAAGAWSSDVVSGPDEPGRPGLHGKQSKPEKADKADKPAKPGKPAAAGRARADAAKPHPHGEPPGLAQRDRGEPPPWSGGPDQRAEEPPGLAKPGPRD